VGVRLLDLVLQRFRPQRPGADEAQDYQRQPDAERPAYAEMLSDVAEQWRSQQERDERDRCQRCDVGRAGRSVSCAAADIANGKITEVPTPPSAQSPVV
jgi:hypothetical protein